ncbi:MAG: sugar ABC transporter permease [Clostridiales bacterium]|uniref:Carbohydrate ABC transporter membrane protein 1 (CUT1 family) n=1 Tax=Harryflintia acetispora TaxID=1849041 RepID=A0A9X8ULQ4_9FIRM|nr:MULTISPECIES: sugar ABC transporter permease [Oscillospiraceae]PWM35184.1 MAG: sugar ABC transporter permease [Clostridiales bacterium]RGB68885.1 sugar ABC transporter permease [Harryflintia acetispora]TCL45283.1 carbohydrate ABC transporter membrane protein 1 (CUT1 family) [Harryflintia acetispora]
MKEKKPGRIALFFKRGKWVDYTFLLPAVLFIAVLMIYPIWYSIDMGFRDVTLKNFVSGDQPFVFLKNFQAVLSDRFFKNALGNTFVFVFVCLVFHFLFGFAFALYFNKNFKGAKWMRALLLIAWMNPTVITGTIFEWILAGDIGILNYMLTSLGIIPHAINFLSSAQTALGSIIFANIWVGIPFNMIILLSGLQGIPGELYESAVIDGAGAWRRFRDITWPMMLPTISVLFLLGFIYTFKVFDLIYAMTKGGPANSSQILSYYSYEKSFTMFRFGEGAAASNISFLIIIALALIYVHISKKEDVAA